MDDPWVRWDWVSSHLDDIAAATRQHVELTVIALAIGLALSFPLALVARRWRWLEAPILSGTGILYTIPSLALFAMLVPWTGLSRTTSEIGLVSYTLLILVRNIVAGLDGVPPDVREAAQGMGFSGARQLLRIELPLAAPAIVAGIRIATVTTIGLVEVTALIGQGGLGQLILDGLNRDFRTPIVVASVLSIALAVIADLSLAGVQHLISPWQHDGHRGPRQPTGSPAGAGGRGPTAPGARRDDDLKRQPTGSPAGGAGAPAGAGGRGPTDPGARGEE